MGFHLISVWVQGGGHAMRSDDGPGAAQGRMRAPDAIAQVVAESCMGQKNTSESPAPLRNRSIGWGSFYAYTMEGWHMYREHMHAFGHGAPTQPDATVPTPCLPSRHPALSFKNRHQMHQRQEPVYRHTATKVHAPTYQNMHCEPSDGANTGVDQPAPGCEQIMPCETW